MVGETGGIVLVREAEVDGDEGADGELRVVVLVLEIELGVELEVEVIGGVVLEREGEGGRVDDDELLLELLETGAVVVLVDEGRAVVDAGEDVGVGLT